MPRPSRVGSKAVRRGSADCDPGDGPVVVGVRAEGVRDVLHSLAARPPRGRGGDLQVARGGGESWTSDGDGACDDARGWESRHRFPRPGRYRVSLCISSGAFLTRTTQEILVAEPQPTFAVVRLQGSYGPTGAQIRQLRVSRSARARIALRCWGPDCPYPRRRVPPGRRVVVFRGFQRHLRSGTRISIFVTQPRRIGRYTAYRVRGGELAPVRRDRCLQLESLRLTRCPG